MLQKRPRPPGNSLAGGDQEQPLKKNSPPLGNAGGNYFKEVLIEVNFSFMVVPRPFTTVMIARAIPAAIRPYSIAVAPDSSDQNF
jgi:hypothetical protein